MKFLCIPCDEPMKLIDTRPPERGSLTVIYRCNQCGHQIAMLTNPYETQIVGSLGVNIGEGEKAEAAPKTSKCPFAEKAREFATAGAVAAGPLATAGEANDVAWTDDALARLDNIPEFVRPMAKTGIERMARENGYALIDAKVMDEAKEFFGM